ncbi:MAG: Bax inhibitor-1/YccA family protein [Candidatus Babeliales bacterium]
MEIRKEIGGTSRFVEQFLTRVYGWMSLGLLFTAATAYWVASTPELVKTLYTSPAILIGLFLAQIAVVIALSPAVVRLNYATAVLLFLGYSLLSGVTLSSVFLVYTQTSIVSTFLVAAGMFGGMSVYGYTTKSDLSGMGSLLLMALWGLILSLLVNMWWQNPEFSYLISGAGVLIFTLLTAYDVQKLKRIAQMMGGQGQSVGQLVVFGALTLYLDFINLFLYLLRFMGQRKK